MGGEDVRVSSSSIYPCCENGESLGIHAPCAPAIMDVLGTDLYGHTSARLPLFNQLWFDPTFRRVFFQIFKGHEPFALLEFLLVHLRTALDKEWMNGCPTLPQVSLYYLVIFVNVFGFGDVFMVCFV